MRVGDYNETGLMQGFLTLPFVQSQVLEIPFVWNYFDIIGNRVISEETTYWDTQDGVSLDFAGRYNRGATRDELARLENLEPIPGVGDSHTGLDFLVPIGNWIISGAPASLVYYLNTGDELGVRLMFQDPETPHKNYESVYGHLGVQLVELNQTVYRGQIVGLSGDTSSDEWRIPQLHYHLAKNTAEGWHYIDPYRYTVELDPLPGNFWGSEVSWWTKDNDAQFPLVRLGE